MSRENLAKLALYLETMTPPPGFDMALYAQNLEENPDFTIPIYRIHEAYDECGTVACAIGHGPKAGIDIGNSLTWGDYADKFTDGDGGVFDWLFDSAWSKLDNTPTGAARRINYYLEHGLPKVFRPARLDAETYQEILA